MILVAWKVGQFEGTNRRNHKKHYEAEPQPN